MIDHSLVRPELTDEQVIAGCELAKGYQVASVSVRPCDVDLAVRLLSGSGVAVGSLAGFPHGSSTTAVKTYEIRDALRRGAKEIDMVLNRVQGHDAESINGPGHVSAAETDRFRIG